MIIGVNGKIGSGKDTVGRIIQYLTLGEEFAKTNADVIADLEHDGYCANKSKFEIKKFAGKLKIIASLLTGVPVYMFEDQEFKKQVMSKKWIQPKHYNCENYDAMDGGNCFYCSCGEKEMTYREFLQKLGTEAMRDGLHTNVWVNALFADYKGIPTGAIIGEKISLNESSYYSEYPEIMYPNWIITDMRFPNEMDAVKERKGITIRVIRPHGYINPHTGEYKEMPLSYHSSETALDDSVFDYEIVNNGSIDDLVEKVKEILIKENII